FFFFQAEDGIRDFHVTGVQTCALPIFDGLRDIFINFKLEIYNRWGKLLWIGDNNKPDWNGYVGEGIGSKLAPDGTYFYILYLNEIGRASCREIVYINALSVTVL